MRALRLLDWKSDPVVVEVDEPTPGPEKSWCGLGHLGVQILKATAPAKAMRSC